MTILIVLLIIIAIPLVVALFVKKSYSVERETIIDKPRAEVFNYIKFLKNQNNYSVWAMMDPAMKKEFIGVDGTPGFVSSWESNNKKVGKGEQEIKSIQEGQRIDLALHFIKPFEGRANAFMETTALSTNQTKVKWVLNSSMKYPMNFMLLLMNMDKMIGNDLATGLTNLKMLLEK